MNAFSQARAGLVKSGPRTAIAIGVVVALMVTSTCLIPSAAYASGGSVSGKGSPTTSTSASGGGELELTKAAEKAKETGRTIAMSLIGLAFAIASIVLAFKRDFKEAVGVIVIGSLAVFLAGEQGLKVLENTVTKLFGA
jgi:hypothetical protein